MSFQKGAAPRLTTTVVTADDVPTNPLNLTLVYRSPAGTETSVAFAGLTDEPGTGVYSYQLPACDLPGIWTWRFESTGPAGVDEGSFEIGGSGVEGARHTGVGPCSPWCSPDDLTTGGWTAPDNADQQTLEQACRAASEACYALGGRRWPGLCWDSILPQCCACSSLPLVLPNGRGGLSMTGGCAGGAFVDLGHGNVTAIDAVRIDGTAIASTTYRLIDSRWLARLDGSWPCSNVPDAATLGFAVDFTFGSAPPALGWLAAVALARELTKGLASADDCAIDPRVTSLVREGVALDLSSVDGDGGFMEVEQVRRFVNALNPRGLQSAAAVIVPGAARHVHL